MHSSGLFNGLSGLSLEDQVLISRFGRGPSIPVPHKTVHEAFQSIVDVHSSVVAAKHGDRTITYEELEASANRLANYLIKVGIRPKKRVCLVVQRSFEMLVGMLAILKAGCQYVPIDGGVSSNQALKHVLADTDSRFVLCLPKFETKVQQNADSDVKIIVLGGGAEDFCSKERPRIPVSAGDGVYAIYTSGMCDRRHVQPKLTIG